MLSEVLKVTVVHLWPGVRQWLGQGQGRAGPGRGKGRAELGIEQGQRGAGQG